MKYSILFCAFLGLSSPAVADSTSSVNNAFGLCKVFDSTGLLSQPCKVSGCNSSVDVKMDTNGREARKMCAGITQMVRQQNIRFDDSWKIRIFSPYSGENTLAQCPL